MAELNVQEDLYSEELALKTAATAQIGGLFRRVQNLSLLLQHSSLLSVLARSLREDARWSLDLSIHILSAFFALSQFSQVSCQAAGAPHRCSCHGYS